MSFQLLTLLFCAVRLSGTLADAQEPAKQSDTSKKEQKLSDDDSRPRYSYNLQQKLNKQSCFDVPIGGKIGELVPVGEVSGAEKTGLKKSWEQVLRPAFLPPKPENISWRKVLWSQVPWAPKRQHAKDSSPSTADGIAARWTVSGQEITLEGYTHALAKVNSFTVSVRLVGDNQIRFRYPTHEETRSQFKMPMPLFDTQIDRVRLYEVLSQILWLPWKSIDDFVIEWSLSAVSAGHLNVRTPWKENWSRPAWWYDSMSLQIAGSDPQIVTVGIIVLP